MQDWETWLKERASLILSLIVMPIWITLIQLILPSMIPFSSFHFWKIGGSVIEATLASWPLFAWGVGVTSLFAFNGMNDRIYNRNAERIFAQGIVSSLFAGIVEEILYRWLLFYSAIAGIQIINFLALGIPYLMYTYLLLPCANVATLGLLHPLLMGGPWIIGAAIVSANGKFRNGHAYQGLLGYVNSWFLGMVFYHLTFKYGLLSAIVVHALYDVLIFVVRYIDAIIERKKGWC